MFSELAKETIQAEDEESASSNAQIVFEDENVSVLTRILDPPNSVPSCIYYVKLCDTPGKFDPKKAAALGEQVLA